jgi:hypothetical protein
MNGNSNIISLTSNFARQFADNILNNTKKDKGLRVNDNFDLNSVYDKMKINNIKYNLLNFVEYNSNSLLWDLLNPTINGVTYKL